MGRSTAKQIFAVAVLALPVLAVAGIGGCQFQRGAPLVLHGNGGAGGVPVIDAGAAAGSGGQGGTRPVIPTIDAAPRADASSMSNPDSNCAAVNQGAAPLPPDLLIVQDRSGSMDWNADATCMRNCGADSRWTQVTAALSEVVSTTDTMVNWGLKFFGSSNSCSVTAAPEVPIGPMNGAAIVDVIGRTNTGSPTPTRNGVNAAAAYMATLTDSNPKYLLLATDGEPTCNPDLPANMMNSADSEGAQAAVMNAFNMGFKTFVVGIGDTMGAATLDQMAINGGMPQTGAATSFYQVTDTASLVAALQTILGRVGSCQFNIGMAPNSMTSNEMIDVFGDGMPIPRDTTHTDGWDYSNADHTAIEVFGPRCEAVKAGTTMNVTVTFRCIIG
jgi:hypothetical protein